VNPIDNTIEIRKSESNVGLILAHNVLAAKKDEGIIR
jgi:hypothetical protein